MNELKLFPEGSVNDLVCRGWSRERVLERTGIDPGYHNASVKTELKGVDRHAYKIEHVKQRVGLPVARDLVERFATCELDKAGVLEQLGLHDAVNLIKLADLFTGLGLGDEFKDADRRARRSTMRAGMVAQYGTDNPFKLEDFQEKAAQTREERYGARYTLADGSVFADEARKKGQESLEPIRRAKRERTLARKKREREERQRERALHGYHRRTLTDEEKVVANERRIATSQSRYGVDHPSQRASFRQSVSQYMTDPENQRRIRARTVTTNQERYGVAYFTQLPEHRQEQSRRMSDPSHQRRISRAKRENGTFNTSLSEDVLYKLLVEYVNQHGMTVVRQYRDEKRYPFAVDFYIPERDLFIELNGSWSHGGHWYEADREMDQRTVQTWLKKGKKSKYYRVALETWIKRDVRKREAARKAQLNYVTLWDGLESLFDAHLWFALGAPDGRDWEREYSWLDLPEWLNDLTVGLSEQIEQWVDIDVTEAGSRQISWLARSAVWETFYARELQMWNDDEVHHRKWGRLRARLLANRLHYLGRFPESALEVVRGLAISGEIRSYSTFINTAMTAVLDQYKPTSLYDPCSGWGERMLTCAQRGVTYTGTDISEAVVQAHQSLIDRLGLTHADVTLGDSATRDMRGGTHEMVLTCPPYGNTEVYTENGAENLDDEAFLGWWKRVVTMSVAPTTRVFAFQISELWRERMSTVVHSVLGDGWRCVDEIDASASRNHFQRSRSRQTHRGETMVVFERL
jgi:hypothetical protein